MQAGVPLAAQLERVVICPTYWPTYRNRLSTNSIDSLVICGLRRSISADPSTRRYSA
jgi:hypothetical protein